MPLKYEKVRGRPSRIRLRKVGPTKIMPATVTVTVATAGAEAGANSIPVTALTAEIPKNTILEFTRAAGDPATMRVVVVEAAPAAAVTIAVESVGGADGDGIPYALAEADVATWDGLYTDYATNNLDFQANEQTNNLTPVTHGSGSGVNTAEREVTSIAPSIPRQGHMLNNGPLARDLLRNFKSPNDYWYAEFELPDETGEVFATYAGFGKVGDVGHPAPAEGMVDLAYTFYPADNDFDVLFAE